MNDNFKYYGFYGRRGNTDEINKRASRQKASSDPKLNYKEFGVYVHTQNDEIPRHLEIEYSKNGEYGENYGNVPNLTFEPIYDLEKEEKDEVQKLIDICYSFYIDETGKYASWAKIHALAREYMYSGYDSGLSKHIVDLYADKAKEELNNNFFNKIFDEQIKPILEKQSKRTCENIHNIDTRLPKNDPTKNVEKLILEDYLYEDGEKQLLLGGREIWNYQNNPKVLNDPWLFRWAQLGFLVWNLMINKASVKCILDNNPALFPMQIILATNPNFLFFEQVNISNENKKENIKYIGYFLVRIKYDKIKNLQKDKNCERLYDYKNDRPIDSKENYFVLFVFKKTFNIYINETGEYKPDEEKNKKLLITDKYILTDFRLQRVHWGNVTRSKRILFIEIQQLMCSLLPKKSTEQKYFYFLSEYENGHNEPINNICKTQHEQINNMDNGKKDNNKCYELWLHDETRKILNDLNYKLEGTSYNILISKEEINSLFTKLKERNRDKLRLGEITIDNWTRDKNFNYIDIHLNNNKHYILFPCHFKWETIDKSISDQKYGNKKKFVIKHGNLDLNNVTNRRDLKYFNSIEYYKNELCLEGECIINRDYIANTFNNVNIFNDNIPIISDEYFGRLDKIKNNLNINDIVIKKNIKLIYENLINKLKKREYINYLYNEIYKFYKTPEDIEKYIKIKKYIDVLHTILYPLNQQERESKRKNGFPELLQELEPEPESEINYKEKIKEIYEIIIIITDILNKLTQEDQDLDLRGGFKENKELNRIFKLIKKIELYKNNLKIIILSNPSLYFNNNIITNIGFNINRIFKKNVIIKHNIYNNNLNNYIENYLNMFINIINYIINGNILIISNNINILLLINKYLDIKDNNIILVLVDININNLNKIYSFIIKNKDKIKIYYFGNILNNELTNNIINFFPNTKFSNIITDIVDDNNQIFYNILAIKICKELLINNGSFIQFTKIPTIKDNIIYLYYYIYKCFKYNFFDSNTSLIFHNNMYSLVFHKNFNYNLNDNEENIINNLLSNDITQKINLNNITFDKLFIDYLYIKYLTIYYNLQNSAEKIFITTYKLIEEKNNTEQLAVHLSNASEQHGGYQINTITKLDLYDSNYTCTFLEKHLFLLHLNFLTKVYLHENKNLDNFYIYYDNDKGYGYYQEILKNMFKQITWTNTNKHDKNKECIFISNNLDMYHKIKPKYALMDLKLDTDNNFFDGEILYTLYPFSNTNFKILVKGYNKIKKYSDNIFQELLDNNKFFNLCYNYDIYNINKVIPIKYLKLIPGYTDNFECILEYKILYNYFYCIHNITDHTIIMNKLFDITIDNENNIKYWINCTLNKFKNAENETDIMFKNIVKLNIEQHAKHQIHLLNDYGSEVLNKQKISKAIKILEKYASDRVYIQIL